MDLPLRGLGIGRGKYLVAFAPQVGGDQQLDRRLVFNYQYLGRHGLQSLPLAMPKVYCRQMMVL
jgi:hypothetical protein